MPRPRPTMASLFTGIGGFDLGFQRCGFEITFQCEIDSFCKSVLEEHWPDVPRRDDIKGVDDADIPVSEVWTGGFPCQDLSVARMGPRRGLRGARSGLFFEFARLLEQCRPGVFVIENVPGLLSSHGGRDFGKLLRTLAKIGYAVGWRMLNSRYFGVPQSRQRMFIVGCYRDRQGPVEILFEPECGEGYTAKSRTNGKKALSRFKRVVGNARKGPVVPDIAYCIYACSARHTGTDWSRNYASYPDGRVRRLTPRECETIQGYSRDWSLPSSYEGDAEKLDTLRYRALGNAVTVPVAAWLADRVRAYLGKSANVRDTANTAQARAG